ncbi:hypothetical protein HDU96_008976 [Phlyctochytrium bullatum]|nr:hypothetical protein HDU96_008976 [Phlyctochytrium bullatum]
MATIDHVTRPARSLANDDNVAISTLSSTDFNNAQGPRLMHRIMQHLSLEDHLNLFQTCHAFRHILAEETGPGVAMELFKVAMIKVGKMEQERYERLRRVEEQNRGIRSSGVLSLSFVDHQQFEAAPLDEKERAFSKTLVRLMTISAPIGAAVLVRMSSKWCPILFDTMCGVWKRGPQCQDVRTATSSWWECCNNTNDEVDHSTTSSMDDGVDQVCATESKMLCKYHRRWFQDVLLTILQHPCYFSDPSKPEQQIWKLRKLVEISVHCRNPAFIPTHLLAQLESSGVLQAKPSSLPPAFDFFPAPPAKAPTDNDTPVPLQKSEPDNGLQCLSQLVRIAFDKEWDPLLDHLLLRYSPTQSQLNDLFQQACNVGRVAVAMRILEVRGHTVTHNAALCTAVEKGNEGIVRFLLWIGRKGTEDAAPPWLQSVRVKLEEAAAQPITNPRALRVTAEGIRAAAHHGYSINPLYPKSRPVRLAVTDGNFTNLNLLVDAIGGWRALSRVDGNETIHRSFVHKDLVFPGSQHVPRGLEDLLMLACSAGRPAMARFFAAKIRESHRADPDPMDADTATDPTALFVTTLSECLVLACDLPNQNDALEIYHALVGDAGDDGASPPSRPLVASPSLRDGHAFLAAVERGHDAIVALLLADPRLPLSALNPGLAAACHRGHARVVAQLLARPEVDPQVAAAIPGGNRNAHAVLSADVGYGGTNADMHPLLTSAIAGGHAETVEVLAADPRIDPVGGSGMALRLACAACDPELVLTLVGSQAYLRAFGQSEEASEESLSALQRSKLLELLTQFVADVVIGFRDKPTKKEGGKGDGKDAAKDKAEGTDKEAESAEKWLEFLKRFLAIAFFDPTTLSNIILRTAVKKGWVEAVELLMEYGRQDPVATPRGLVDPSDANNEALRLAANAADPEKGLEIVRLLLRDPRVDPSVQDSEPFRVAAARGDIALLEVLVEAGKGQGGDGPVEGEWILVSPKRGQLNVNAKGGEALVEAVRGDHVETVRYLLHHVPELHPDVNNGAALLLACQLGRAECVRLLVEHPGVNAGANASQALIEAATKNHVEVVRVLLADMKRKGGGPGAGIDNAVDPADRDYEALRKACEAGHWEVVRVFAQEGGVDVDECPDLLRNAVRDGYVAELMDAMC